ncbi:MAG: hypothetical protein AAB896_00495 [Patescibacteria group bacterium]
MNNEQLLIPRTEGPPGKLCLVEVAEAVEGKPYKIVRDRLEAIRVTDLLDHGHPCSRSCPACYQVAVSLSVGPEGDVKVGDDESRSYCVHALTRAAELIKSADQ